MGNVREIKESPWEQGADEKFSYSLTTTPYGSSPSGVSVTVFSVLDGVYTDAESTVMPTNTPSVNGDVITLSPLKSLAVGTKYRLEIKFTADGNDWEPYAMITGVR